MTNYGALLTSRWPDNVRAVNSVRNIDMMIWAAGRGSPRRSVQGRRLRSRAMPRHPSRRIPDVTVATSMNDQCGTSPCRTPHTVRPTRTTQIQTISPAPRPRPPYPLSACGRTPHHSSVHARPTPTKNGHIVSSQPPKVSGISGVLCAILAIRANTAIAVTSAAIVDAESSVLEAAFILASLSVRRSCSLVYSRGHQPLHSLAHSAPAGQAPGGPTTLRASRVGWPP